METVQIFEIIFDSSTEQKFCLNNNNNNNKPLWLQIYAVGK
jgi:hypothetical protein